MPHLLTPAEAHEQIKSRRRTRRQRLHYLSHDVVVDAPVHSAVDLADEQAEAERIVRGMLSGRGQ